MLHIKDLSLILKNRTVLNDISLHLQKGEILGITGPGGSGKSLLLKAICGEIKTGPEHIRLENKSIGDFKKKEFSGKISYLGSDAGYNPEATIFDEVLNGRLHLKKTLNPFSEKDRDATISILESFNISADADKRLKALSGSLIRLVQIAKILNSESPVILFDSPDQGLDPAGKIRAIRNIKKYTSRGDKGIIAVSPDPGFLVKVCDRIIFMKSGRIEESGTPDLINPELIKKIFGVNSLVVKNLVNGLPEIQITDTD